MARTTLVGISGVGFVGLVLLKSLANHASICTIFLSQFAALLFLHATKSDFSSEKCLKILFMFVYTVNPHHPCDLSINGEYHLDSCPCCFTAVFT